jgi:hypothetical protein
MHLNTMTWLADSLTLQKKCYYMQRSVIIFTHCRNVNTTRKYMYLFTQYKHEFNECITVVLKSLIIKVLLYSLTAEMLIQQDNPHIFTQYRHEFNECITVVLKSLINNRLKT